MASVTHLKAEVNSFQITSKSETVDFVTVKFKYNYCAKVGNSNVNGDIEGASVLLKTGEGYRTIFVSQRQ